MPFPFSDLGGLKRRPALIIASVGQEIICMMLTSSAAHQGDLPINYEDAGLPKPTIARIHLLFTIKKPLIIKTIGKLPLDDMEEIRKALIKLIQKGTMEIQTQS